MMQEEQDRLGRLEKLRQSGVDPYPTKGNRTSIIQEFLDQFDALQSSSGSVTLVGRLRLLRPHGGLTFGQIQDESGLVQIAFKKDHLADTYEQIQDTIDIGDFLEVSGTAFTTKKGERSVDVAAFRILTKTLLPLPEKWHGVSDVETRFRKRYLDLIMNEDVRKTLRTRSKIISAIRSLLDSRGFLEVETPTLQPVYGGGFARPFVTHHHALDTDFYLRISDEMYLKRLLVGGFEKVYEITKVFRNEGIDRDHNPEFTMFEAQIAYENYEYGMELFEEIFENAAKATFGTTQIQHEETLIELKRPWKKMRLIDAVEEIGGISKDIWECLEKEREKAGFDEAHQTDMDYLEAIKHGMPPACGLGIGIDRMVMLLTGAKNIKEVILFPTLRPEQH